jgi:hypothetical protein
VSREDEDEEMYSFEPERYIERLMDLECWLRSFVGGVNVGEESSRCHEKDENLAIYESFPIMCVRLVLFFEILVQSVQRGTLDQIFLAP